MTVIRTLVNKPHKNMKISTITVILVLSYTFISVCKSDEAEDCIYKGVNLNSFKTNSPNEPWMTKDANFTYEVNLCSKLTTPSPCDGAAVCRMKHDRSDPVKMGTLASADAKDDGHISELWLSFSGEDCPAGVKYKATFYLKCGHSLGSPVVIHSESCETYFEWYTTALCKGEKPKNQVKCYAYDDTDKFDLNPLSVWDPDPIRVSETEEFKFSVCRSIGEADYGADTAAVLLYKGRPSGPHFVVGGKPGENLKMSADGRLYLTYSDSKDNYPQCSNDPLTTVTFICPRRGGSKQPRLIEHNGCQFVLEWETEYACAENTLTNTDCFLTDAVHGIGVDFRSLEKDEPYYSVSGTSENPDGTSKTYAYVLNICGKIDTCGSPAKEGASVCQRDPGNADDPGKVLGTVADKQLRYADGIFTLTYRNGDHCRHNNFQRETIIKFECNETASGLEFIKEDDCSYWFKYATPLACFATDPHTMCSFQDDKKQYDLSILQKTQGTDWEVITDDDDSAQEYWINICGAVLHPKCVEKGLPWACMHDKSTDNFVNIGKIGDRVPSVDGNEVILTYDNGEDCPHLSNTKYTSTVSLICAPGVLGSAPLLVSSNECSFVFEWRTAAACVQHNTEGSQCRVHDEEQGYDFDLSSLRVAEEPYYTTSSEKHDYKLNVCASVPGCANAGVCQTSKDQNDGRAFNTGNANDRLKYENGVLKLVYTDGDLYSDGRSRETEIVFVCDENIAKGQPEFGTELIPTYSFQWFTKLACPEAVVIECTAKDGEEEYDLSKLSSADRNWEAEHDGKRFYISVCGSLLVDYDSPVVSCDRGAAVCSVIVDGDKIDVANLGKARSRPEVTDNGLRLVYSDGATCKGEKKYQTIIELTCEKGALNTKPTFKGISNDCTYEFEWSTMEACALEDEKGEASSEQCSVEDDNSEFTFNLAPLRKEGGYTVNTASGKTYKVNVCGKVDCPEQKGDAGDTAACEDSAVIGNLDTTTSLEYFDAGILTLTYIVQGSSISTVIRFICDDSVAMGVPIFKQKSGDTYEFEFATSLACAPRLVDCSITDEHGNEYDLTALQRTDKNWNETTPSGTSYYINVCSPIVDENVGCPGRGRPVKPDEVCKNPVKGYIKAWAEAAKRVCGRDQSQLTHFVGEIVRGPVEDNYDSSDVNQACRQIKKAAENIPAPISAIESHDTEVTVTVGEGVAQTEERSSDSDCVITGADTTSKELCERPVKRDEGAAHTHSSQGEKDTKLSANAESAVEGASSEKLLEGPIAGCQVTSGGDKFSMGYVQSKPTLLEDGTILLRYLNGDHCHVGKPNESWRSTKITFTCSKTEKGPVFVGESPTCEYSFNWETPSACPIRHSTGTDCVVTDATYGTTFDLSVLRKARGNYVASGSNHWYELNVCSPLNGEPGEGCDDGEVAVCQVDPSNSTYINAGHASHNLSYSAGEIILTYTGGKDNCHKQYERHTEITFTCDFGAVGTSGPVFVEEDDECTYHFAWPTSLACPSGIVMPSCELYTENGAHYDLGALTLSSSNYEVSGPLGTNSKFLLNICGPVVPGKGANCPPNSAACLVNTGEEKSFTSIGDLSTSNLKQEQGHLVLEYTTEDNCKTEIILTCGGEEDFDNVPHYLFKEGTCSYSFQWKTPEACAVGSKPLKPPTIEGSCVVENPQTGHIFDLSRLKKADGYTMDDNQGHDFTINVCGRLKGGPCGDDVGACQVQQENSGNFWNAGKANGRLIYREGSIFLNYTEGKACHGGQFDRNTVIEFVCGEGEGHPLFLVETNDCTYYVRWHTALACEKQFGCEVQTSSEILSLIPLVNEDGNHIATSMVTDENAAFYINVCAALNPIPGTLCPAGAGVCMVPEQGQPKSLGQMKTEPLWDSENKKIVVEYDGGDQCEGNAEMRLTATIIFVCEAGPDMGKPQLVKINGCEYEFEWRTNIVCTEKAEEVESECTYKDSVTGYTFDFSGLYKKDNAYEIVDGSITYLLNVCGEAKGCDSGTAVCTKSDKTGYGVLQDATFLRERDDVKLAYGKTGTCTDSTQRQAIILFTCDETKTGDTSPTLLWKTECTVVFSWETDLACPPVTRPCVTASGPDVYDLGLLSRSQGSWIASDSDGLVYWFNLCQSVHGLKGCPKSAAVCRSESMDTSSASVLGWLTSQAIEYTDGHVIVTYSKGDKVCKNNDNTAEVKIHLFCGKTIGSAKFSKKTDNNKKCLFEFEWKTSVACEDRSEQLSLDNWILKEPRSGEMIDLTIINDNRDHEVTATGHVINLIGSTSNDWPSECDGAAICSKSEKPAVSIGDRDSAKYFFEGNILEAVYTSTTKCDFSPKKTKSSFIEFKCPSTHGQSLELEPIYEYGDECVSIFFWYTSQVCLNITENSAPKHIKSSPSTGSSSGSTVAIVVSVLVCVVLALIVGVVLRDRNRRNACFTRVRRVFARDGNASYRYSQLADCVEGDRAGLLSTADQGYGSGSGDLPTFGRDSDDDLIL